MRQKKKGEDAKMEDKPEACVKCSKMQNGGHSSFDESETHSKQTTLSTLKSVLKRSSSHKKDKLAGKSQSQSQQSQQQQSKDGQSGTAKKHKNRVQFDETRNKYFEADYVILIHEEDYDLDDYYDEGSPYDDEDDDIYDDGLMGQKICCSNPNCNNMISLGRYPPYGYSAGYVDFKHSHGLDRDRYDFSSHYYDVNYQEINQNSKKSSKSATNRCENEKCHNCRNYFDFEAVVAGQIEPGSNDFGDQVTLSPPEGYKDGGGPQCCPHHGLQFHQIVGTAADKSSTARRLDYREDEEEEEELEDEISENVLGEEESQTDPDPSEAPAIPSDTADEFENDMQEEEKREKLKQRYIVETITMTTVTERRIVRETAQDEVLDGAKKSGILKGGKFWKNSTERVLGKTVNYNEVIDYKENRKEEKSDASANEKDNGNEKREEEAAGEAEDDEDEAAEEDEEEEEQEEEERTGPEEKEGRREEPDEAASPESTELTLTFKLGQHVHMGNSLKPNSAVRQLFPSPRFLSPPPLPDEDDDGAEGERAGQPKQFLVTAESLRLFEEAKKSKAAHGSESGFVAIMPPMGKDEGDGQRNRIRRTIERNTLRRSLIRYPCDLRSKRMAEKRKKENSLEERIKQLTCGVDDEPTEEEKKEEEMAQRSSPQGEEAKEQEGGAGDLLHVDAKALRQSESTSPSSNSSSSSGGSTYKKLTDIFVRKNIPIMEDVNCNIKSETQTEQFGLNGPDLGNESILLVPKNNAKNSLTRMQAAETRRQFLSTLAPLAACVTSVEGKERLGERYRMIDGRDRFPSPGERLPAGEDSPEYTLDDIEDGLKEKKIGIQPDVIAGTPQNETANDELALFVQQDAGRIEKLKKRYSVSDDKSDEDDDYGFNKRPTVKGIKPRASADGHKSWPYYSEGAGADGKVRAEGGPHAAYAAPQEYRAYAEAANAGYEYKARPHPAAPQQSPYAPCQPMRIGAGTYAEVAGYPFRHPSRSPPPVRHATMTPQPSPNPSEEGRSRGFDASAGFDARSDLGIPEVTPRHPDGVVRNPESFYYRRTVPNVHNPCLQMKFSPINYHQGTVPTASIRFSASCAPHPIVDESNVIIEPHYSTLPHPPGSVGVIRVGQGQQTIRVPVPYPTGSPVQLHLMAGRVGRCDSPQRPGSPQGLAKGQIQSYNQYLIAKGTQTAQIQTFQIPVKSVPDGAPSDGDRVDFEAQGKAIAEELQTRQKLSRSLSQEAAGYQQARYPPRSASPVKTQSERGVPEGAASSSLQDGQPQPGEGSHPAGNTIYYSMNV